MSGNPRFRFMRNGEQRTRSLTPKDVPLRHVPD
jgi:hypothetical protein